jgi:hypothetical protein
MPAALRLYRSSWGSSRLAFPPSRFGISLPIDIRASRSDPWMPYRYREGFWTASMAGRVCAALLAAIARCVVCQTRLPLHKQMHRNASCMTVGQARRGCW